MKCMDIQEVTSRSFMPISECPSARCRTNNTKGRLSLQVRGSKFTKFQEVRSAPFHYHFEQVFQACEIQEQDVARSTILKSWCPCIQINILLLSFSLLNDSLLSPWYTPLWQAKIQELADQVPKGHIPRSMTVQIHGELTRQVCSTSVSWKCETERHFRVITCIQCWSWWVSWDGSQISLSWWNGMPYISTISQL